MERTAYFAGGCFWCITPIFKIYGASKVISGYSGGSEVNPTYDDVKHQKTGHRETIAVIYDDEKVGYKKLLELYLANVDPFDGEGQFIDRGHSYTLAIYYSNEEELSLAKEAIHELEIASGKQAQIALEPFQNFYEAEEYHQDFYLKNPDAFEKEIIESGRKK
ncbi:peptide methionine sulfoxide reductase MsrA [Lachnospiraceae bacterium KM106-2]|nr:peptide methionine sulfoxide reductase MsrA [Lachnospiraceae bacterium KM106-2]